MEASYRSIVVLQEKSFLTFYDLITSATRMWESINGSY